MYGPIVVSTGKVTDWKNFNTLCMKLLGYIPEPNKRLSKPELHALGFEYAAKSRPFSSPVYGRIIHLL